jgi:hypothetical protein
MPVASATPKTLHEGYSLQANEKLGTDFLLSLHPFRVINAAQLKATAQLVFLIIFFIFQ